MNCPQCQQPLREGAQFCTNCGLRTLPGRDSLSQSVLTVEAGDNEPTASTSGAADPLIGRVLDGKYEIASLLGEGGMGAVYRARRVHIGDDVALKVLHHKFLTDASAIERFRREARAAAQLHHPNIVTIHDYGEAGGAEAFAYIVMELVSGTSLRDLLKREQRLDVARAVNLMRDICAGVGAAHRRNIVHRDIKPDNIIVLAADDERERETVKVVDFGIAKLRDMATDHTLTQAGMVIGTPYYMSPEQCRGESLDARADVYSLGAMLYEMLAGMPPFTAQSVTGVIAKHLTESPPPVPVELRVPRPLENAIIRALAKEPDGRQADATILARELQSATQAVDKLSATASGMPATPTLPPPLSHATPTSPNAHMTATPPQSLYQTPVPTSPTPPPQQQFATPTNPPYNATGGQAHGTFVPPTTPQRKTRARLLIGLLVVFLVVVSSLVVGTLLLWNNRDDRRARARAAQDSAAQNSVAARPSPANMVTGTTNAPANTAVDKGAAQVDRGAAQREIAALLENWTAATRAHNLDGHMSFYADTLDTYYMKRGASVEQVRADRARAFTRYKTLDVKLSELRITPDASGTHATAIFNKSWDFGGDRHSTGEVKQMMWLTKVGGRWLITGEKDLQVLQTSTEETQ